MSAVPGLMESQLKPERGFALCIDNRDCDDLDICKVYQVIPDGSAAEEGYLRVIDESGEDYLYPQSYFVLIDLPKEAQNAVISAS